MPVLVEQGEAVSPLFVVREDGVRSRVYVQFPERGFHDTEAGRQQGFDDGSVRYDGEGFSRTGPDKVLEVRKSSPLDLREGFTARYVKTIGVFEPEPPLLREILFDLLLGAPFPLSKGDVRETFADLAFNLAGLGKDFCRFRSTGQGAREHPCKPHFLHFPGEALRLADPCFV